MLTLRMLRTPQAWSVVDVRVSECMQCVFSMLKLITEHNVPRELTRTVIVAYQSTARCRYNTVNFLTNIYKIHPIARPLGRAMGVFCGSSIWLTFCLNSCNDICICFGDLWLMNLLRVCELARKLLFLLDLTDKSTLVQVMAWCRQDQIFLGI